MHVTLQHQSHDKQTEWKIKLGDLQKFTLSFEKEKKSN